MMAAPGDGCQRRCSSAAACWALAVCRLLACVSRTRRTRRRTGVGARWEGVGWGDRESRDDGGAGRGICVCGVIGGGRWTRRRVWAGGRRWRDAWRRAAWAVAAEEVVVGREGAEGGGRLQQWREVRRRRDKVRAIRWPSGRYTSPFFRSGPLRIRPASHSTPLSLPLLFLVLLVPLPCFVALILSLLAARHRASTIATTAPFVLAPGATTPRRRAGSIGGAWGNLLGKAGETIGHWPVTLASLCPILAAAASCLSLPRGLPTLGLDTRPGPLQCSTPPPPDPPPRSPRRRCTAPQALSETPHVSLLRCPCPPTATARYGTDVADSTNECVSPPASVS